METAVTMTTIAGRERAEALAEQLIVAELAACVQITEVSSVYRWEGKIQKEHEFLLIIKGRSDLFPRLQAFILAHHDYDLPELIKLDIVDGNPKYLRWLEGS
jgi:periplasmic divalent cation tolerance protein